MFLLLLPVSSDLSSELISYQHPLKTIKSCKPKFRQILVSEIGKTNLHLLSQVMQKIVINEM